MILESRKRISMVL